MDSTVRLWLSKHQHLYFTTANTDWIGFSIGYVCKRNEVQLAIRILKTIFAVGWKHYEKEEEDL